MNFKKIPKSQSFKRYFLSYFLVFLIPIFFSAIIIGFFYSQILKDEMTATNEQVLNQASIQLDEQILELSSLGNKINHSNEFSPYFIDRENNYQNNIETLKIFADSTPYARGIFVTLNDSGLTITNDGIISTSGLFNHITEFYVKEKEELQHNIHNPSNNVAVYTRNRVMENTKMDKVIHYMMPLDGRNDKYGSIIFTMNPTIFESTLSTIGSKYAGRIAVILDENLDVVYTNENMNVLDDTNLLPKLTHDIINEEEQFSLDGYTVTIQNNHLTNWSFLTIVKNSQYYQPLFRALSIFLIILIIGVFIGALLSVYFSRKTYEPLRQLTNVIATKEDNIVDEWSFVRNHVMSKQNEYEILNERIEEQIPIIRESLLLNLLEGDIHLNKTQLINQLEAVNLHFIYELYTVLIVEFHDLSNEAKNITDIDIIANKINNQPLEGYILESTIPFLKNNQILVIINHNKDNINFWNQSLEEIKFIINQSSIDTEIEWRISVGNSYNNLLDLNLSFIEASSALEAFDFNKYREDNVLFFKDISNQNKVLSGNQILNFPEEDSLILMQSLKKGNKERALKTFDSIFNQLSENDPNNIYVKAVISDLFNSILKFAVDSEVEGYTEILQRYNHHLDFSNNNQIREVLLEFIHVISEKITTQINIESEEMEKKVVEFVYTNFDSTDISLEEIASKFDISISYASKLIKDETGNSFSNIVQTLRMDLFKELLVTTKEPIKDLVQKIGYYDASNFTRKFREENNITPSEYRKKYKD